MWSLNTLVYGKKERNLLTLKEGECISPFLHYIGPHHRLRVMFGIWPVEWLQHTSPDDWKVLESTPSFCCSALFLAQFRSIQYRWDYCVMQNASSCSYALLWTFPCCLCNDRQQCLPSITGWQTYHFQQLGVVSLYLLFPFVTFILFDRNKIVFFFSLTSLWNCLTSRRGFICS